MKRSEFLNRFLTSNENNAADLSLYTKPLTQQEVIHLLRRTTFTLSWKTIKKYIGKTADVVVEEILNNASKNPLPTSPKWVNDTFKAPWKLPQSQQQAAYDAIYKKLYEENYELKRWWMEVMTAEEASIREKMTLFWHGHFTTKFAIDQIMPAQLMYRQNIMFRRLHQGNFRELVENIILDGAMLIFLNGQDSTKKSPNENFSRELLELYTTGIGHYTEKDVQEGAKVFTGWRTNIFSDEWLDKGVYKTFFIPTEHDTTAKTYLDEVIPATQTNTQTNVFSNEIKILVDIVLRKKGVEVSKFICDKLFRYFVYSNPSQVDNDVISQLAQTFRDSKFEIRPVLAKLLKSKFFFDQANVGVQIKTPSELVIGTTKHFNVEGSWKEWVMLTIGQELFNPPNVSGWAGYRKWMDTRTFPYAVQQFGYFIWNQKDDYMLSWISQFDSKEDPKALTKQILTMFLAKEPSDSQVNKYLKYLLGGSPDYEWPNMLKTPTTAGLKLRYMLVQLVKSPEYFLG